MYKILRSAGWCWHSLPIIISADFCLVLLCSCVFVYLFELHTFVFVYLCELCTFCLCIVCAVHCGADTAGLLSSLLNQAIKTSNTALEGGKGYLNKSGENYLICWQTSLVTTIAIWDVLVVRIISQGYKCCSGLKRRKLLFCSKLSVLHTIHHNIFWNTNFKML